MSCAAPTRALCPDSPSTTLSGNPARRAIRFRMRGIWLASSFRARRTPQLQRAEQPAAGDARRARAIPSTMATVSGAR